MVTSGSVALNRERERAAAFALNRERERAAAFALNRERERAAAFALNRERERAAALFRGSSLTTPPCGYTGSVLTRTATILTTLLACAAPLMAQNKADEKEWVQLFDGKSLNGWIPKITGFETGENFANTFRVDNGVLKVSYDGYDAFNNRFGHLFYKDKFSHYLLAVEYRFTGQQAPGGPSWALRNSGAMLHSQDPRSMRKDQDFPISIEVQFLGGSGTGTRPTANLCTPGTNVVRDGKLWTTHCLNSSSKTYHGEQWVRVEVLVLGDAQFRHLVEGETVLAYEMPQIGGGSVSNHDPAVKRDGAPLSEGWISLQSESHPIEFRKVELLNLKGCMEPKASNYKSYYVRADNAQCRP
jgi:hypothetical protein